MNLAKLSINRPTFISAVIVVMLIVGVIFMNRMKVDMFPDVNFPFISVTVQYPGAGPKEMETLVSKILEEQFSSISGLKNVTSISQDGISIVFGEFTLETDAKYAEQQVRDKIAQVRNRFPQDIKEPVIKKFDPADLPVLILSLKADLSPSEIYDLADTTIKDALQQVPNVSSVEIVGGTKREIHVELDKKKLKDYEASITMVSGRIASNSENIPIGKVTQGKKDLTFRSMGEFRSIKQIKDVVVSFFASDVPITLDKIGDVFDSNEEEKTRGFINGNQAVILNVYKQSDANTVAVSDNLLKRIKKLNNVIKDKKGKPNIIMVRDSARPIRMNLTDVKVTIMEGIILAIFVVYLFLGNFRSTFITIVALPNSLVGAFIFMGLFGFSINMLTLMALSLAVGLLIDDAIVVRENIFRHMENGESAIKAAEHGTNEVSLAVIATTLAVVSVFLPVAFLQGMVGQFFKQFGLTIVFAMSISLFDALTTAPMLSAYMIGKVKAAGEKEEYTGISAVLHAPALWFGYLYDIVERFYEKAMHYTLKHKAFVLIMSVIIFFASLTLVTGIPKTFMPSNEWGEFKVIIEAQPGTSLDQMAKYSQEIDQLLRKEKDIELVFETVGDSNGETDTASFFVKMIPSEKRKISTADMKEYVRKLLSPYKDKLNPRVNDIAMVGDDQPYNLVLNGDDLEVLSETAKKLIEKLKYIPGLVDLDTNYRPGKPEFQVKMDPKKMQKLGVLSTSAGMELRGMVEGMTPAKYRENDLEYDIRVRLKDSQRDITKDFDNLYVPNVNNQLVKLKNIAQPYITTGPSKVFRKNRSRYVMISGNLGKDGAIGNITDASQKIMKAEKLPPGVTYNFLGASEDMVDLFRNMLIAAGLSLVFIYLVLASLYESLIVPFTIMMALPLAIVGGLIALFITGQSLSMFTMIGFIMLLGLVTKNSILLVDYTQKLMQGGMNKDEALIKAGLTRLRPILMTTFALIAGMLPIALGLTEVGKFRRSMGIAIIGGLLSSTVLTLVVIPAAFGYMDSLRRWFRKLFGRPESWESEV
jgi:HAE1 family hydrophobic/amphiphilic exporter-1